SDEARLDAARYGAATYAKTLTCLLWLQNVRICFFSSRRRHTRFSRDWSSDVALPISRPPPAPAPTASSPGSSSPPPRSYGTAHPGKLGAQGPARPSKLACVTDQQRPGAPTRPRPDTEEGETGFHVRLDNFEGPFDLLLQLIGKHKLDVTELALHQIASEFIAYVTALAEAWNLEETSEFLLVAATLLDLKTARLLPNTAVDDEEDLALLEARDLLFARLLQYKAYKEAAGHLAALAETAATRTPRTVGLEERFRGLLPELDLDITPEQLAALA